MRNDDVVFNPEDFQKRIESEDFDPSNLTEEDKKKLAMMRFFEDDWDAGITVTRTPRK